MKPDIETREDLYLIVKDFYVKLMNDDLMRHFFVEFQDNELLEAHLQILADFWDNILFYSGAYQRNAMKPHLDLQQSKPFEKEHFEKWLFHFNTSVDAHFEGANSHIVKTRALSIATVMQFKVLEARKK